MHQIWVISAVFFGIYIYLFSNIFGFKNDPNDTSQFFNFMDSTPLNNSVIYNKTGPEIRSIARQILPKLENNDLNWKIQSQRQQRNNTKSEGAEISTRLEYQRSQSSSFFQFIAEVGGNQFSWKESYSQIIGRFEHELLLCQSSDSKDFINYILSDQDFLERYSRLKYQINRQDRYQYDFNETSNLNLLNNTQLEFQEYTVIMQKFYEYMIESQFEKKTEHSEKVGKLIIQQYLSFMIHNSKSYESFRNSTQFRRSLLNKKSTKFSKLRFDENAYQMFYKDVILNQFIPYSQRKYQNTENIVMYGFYKSYLEEIQRSKLESKNENLAEIAENKITLDDLKMYNNILQCLPFKSECYKCQILLDLDLQILGSRFSETPNQKLDSYSLWRQTKAIIQHEEYLQFEQKTNEIKHMIKLVYATGLGLSFTLSAFTVNYYLQKGGGKSASKSTKTEPKEAEKKTEATKSKKNVQKNSQQTIDKTFDKFLMPILNQKDKKLKRSDQLLGERTGKKFK